MDSSLKPDVGSPWSSLADANADWASVINIGQSYEGRDMNVLAITKAGPGAPNIWLEAGIHAREWIAPAVATFIVRELVEDYAEHPDYIDKINWYFIPSANPDGYTYSWEHDRMWRKTRSDNGGILGCKGVDPNRNWGFHYGESGVSHNRCMETYCGPEAFSEVEMRNIRDFVTTLDPVPVLGHCFHSYSQLWLWPYGYDYGAYPENRAEIEQLAIDAADALYQVHGTVFDPINSADLYPAAGAADDWYKGVLGTRYAFTTELRDTGVHGFVLPKDQIIPSGEEMWAGFEVVINKILSDIQES
jgi:murein tripeptide amidase MpaA